jgi:hypothetical protein
MKRPLEVLTKVHLENLTETKENIIFNFNQIDKILVWIVGFSITAISLIVSNIAGLNSNFETHILKTILLLLCTSIISGIIYRFSALFYLADFQQKLFYLKGAFSNYEMTPTDSETPESSNINELYLKIKKGFDIDYSDVVRNHENNNDKEIKELSISFLNKEYKRLTQQAKEEEKFSNNFIIKSYKEAFGISEKRWKKIVNYSKNTFLLKFWSCLKIVMLSISVVSFITSIIIISSNYK